MAKKNKIKVSLTKNMTIFCRRNQSIIIKSVIPLIYSATSVNVVKLPYPNTGIGHKLIFFLAYSNIFLCLYQSNITKKEQMSWKCVLQRTILFFKEQTQLKEQCASPGIAPGVPTKF